MSKITLTNLVSLQNETTAVNAINVNNNNIVSAFDNTLSRDGTFPNTMNANIDMNSNQILNLPAPAVSSAPLRLQDLASFTGGGTITNIPAGGTTGQGLVKTSNTDYQVGWASVDTNLTGPITSVGNATSVASQTGTGSTFVMNTSPTLVTPNLGTPSAVTLINATGLPVSTGISGLATGVATFLATPSSANLATALTDESGTGVVAFTSGATLTSPIMITPTLGVASATSINKVAITAPATSATLTIANSKTLTANNSLTLAGTDATTLTFQGTDTYVGRATTDTLTNKTFNSTGTGNVLQVSGVTVSSGQYPGEPSTGSATAGNVGEYVTATGSGVALTNGTPANMVSMSLTAGDWDLSAQLQFTGNAATTVSYAEASVNSVSATPLNANTTYMAGVTYFGTINGSGFGLVTPTTRISISTTTTVYAIAKAGFGVNTMSVAGILRARRVR